jgi:hypothetical protein
LRELGFFVTGGFGVAGGLSVITEIRRWHSASLCACRPSSHAMLSSTALGEKISAMTAL